MVLLTILLPLVMLFLTRRSYSILGGLDPEYDTLVTSLTTHIELIDLVELHGYLLSHELHIEKGYT